MSAHTKGPWELNPSGVSEDGDLLYVVWPHVAVFKNRHNRIADVKGEENAYLIAAAPDLYEALKAFLAIPAIRSMQDAGPIGEGWQSDELELALKLADAAIGKAEGKA